MADMKISDAVMATWAEVATYGRCVARTIQRDGIDLMQVATPSDVPRGTPIYARADADWDQVQHRMRAASIRVLPVLGDGVLLGFVDTADLVQRTDPSADVVDGSDGRQDRVEA